MAEKDKVDISSVRDLQSVFKDLDKESKKYLENMTLTKDVLKEQTTELLDQISKLKESNSITEEQETAMLNVLSSFEKIKDSSKKFGENLKQAKDEIRAFNMEKISKGIGIANEMIGKVSSSLAGIGNTALKISAGFAKSKGAGITAGIGALLELIVAVNKELVEMNRQAISVGGSLGRLAAPGRKEAFEGLQAEVRAATRGMTMTYGREVTKEMIGAGAGIGIAPTAGREIEYIGAAARVIGTDMGSAAELIANISVKTGKGIEYTATVFQQFGSDFEKVRENVKMSFEDYITQVMSIYDSTRLYGGSLEEATALTKTFASELRTGTLSMSTLTNVMTTGGKSPVETFKALGWLGAMGMSVGGSVGGAPVSGMSPVAQSMAIFTDPKIQDALISQLMRAGQKFGAQMGYGGAEGKLVGEYFQREFVSQVFGVNLGSAEWKTFQEKVMPAMAKGVPAEEAMAREGLASQEDTMKDYVSAWSDWASQSLTFEDKIAAFLQIMSLNLGMIPGMLSSLINGVAVMFPNVIEPMFEVFTFKAEELVKGLRESKAAGPISTSEYENVMSRFKALTEAFPKSG